MRGSSGARRTATPRTRDAVRPAFAERERGMISAALVLGVGAIAAAAFGLLFALHRHHRLTRLQLELDTCAGRAALELRATQRAIEGANRRMRAERAAAAATTVLLPPAAAALKAALTAEVALQDLRRQSWELRRLSWLAAAGCGTGAAPPPLPALAWHRPPPDSLGPRPLEWRPGAGRRLKITLRHRHRGSAAVVEDRSKGGDWRAQWVSERAGAIPGIGAGFR
jgi:hypothetical protein